ncbi:MurR/RpiR family transcriptional regulator [Fictibacillus gelatini]|uniref:MurR/RpiR family transcriptional regulator n=1 Tax=Fictibacillus gelatini TaxID=225985 RepID=UPI00040D4465|nr:MurR/RpiR family transcriptional regulator [Fictibacillus gelatini]
MQMIEQMVNDRFYELSKGQQKVAHYLLEQKEMFAVKSADEIGKAAGVSEATVIRFCYAIGLEGFSHLQKLVREQLFPSKTSLSEYEMKKLGLAGEPDFFAHSMQQDCHHIQQTIEAIRPGDIERTVENIIRANRVYIAGARSSYAAAHWLSFALGVMRNNVHLFRPEIDDLATVFSEMDETSTFIGISFHRYVKETVKMAELAKGQKAFVIGITDSAVAPISRYSDVLLSVSLQEKSTLDASPALFSLLNAITANVLIKDRERFEKRKRQYEAINDSHLFVE